jgi:hypothetical protein
VDGWLVGPVEGPVEGVWELRMVGSDDGATEGVADGLDDGEKDGPKDGIIETEGELEGTSVEMGTLVGVGAALGISDGLLEGPPVGVKEGVVLGRRDGGILISPTFIIDWTLSMKASNCSFSCSNSSSTLVWSVTSSSSAASRFSPTESNSFS